MIQPDFNNVFCFVLFCFWGGREGDGKGGIFVVTSAFKTFVFQLDMGKSIFLNIFFKIERHVRS